MATYTYEVSTTHNNYENMTVYDRFRDGVQSGWRVNANEGYVMYQPSVLYPSADPETGEPIEVHNYFTLVMINPYYNWDNFDYVAVPRESVDENYIFGGPNDKPEVM